MSWKRRDYQLQMITELESFTMPWIRAIVLRVVFSACSYLMQPAMVGCLGGGWGVVSGCLGGFTKQRNQETVFLISTSIRLTYQSINTGAETHAEPTSTATPDRCFVYKQIMSLQSKWFLVEQPPPPPLLTSVYGKDVRPRHRDV